MKHLFKTVVINLRKDVWTTIINVVGLSVAFTVFMSILLFARYEFGYDSSHKNRENIYRLGTEKILWSGPVVDALEKDIPEIAAVAPLWCWNSQIKIAPTGEKSENVVDALRFATHEGLSEIFTLKLLYGDMKRALNEPGKLAIPQSVAQKLFGDENALNKTVKINFGRTYTIMAVYEDMPANSSIPSACYTHIFSVQSPNGYRQTVNSNFQIFIKTKPNTDIADVESKFPELFESVYQIKIKDNPQEWGFIKNIQFLPLPDFHFSPRGEYDELPHGNKLQVMTLLLMSFLVILIALFNFINYLSAVVPGRIHSYLLSRVFGSSRRLITMTILTETLVITLTAYLIAVIFLPFTVEIFASILGFDTLSYRSVMFYLGCGGIAVAMSLLAGIYPAVFSASIKLEEVTRSKSRKTAKGNLLRAGLTIFQFFITTGLVISVFFVVKQNRYIGNYDIGLQKENIICFNNNRVFSSEMLSHTAVLDFTTSRTLPGQNSMMGWGREINGKEVRFNVWEVSPNFLRFFGIETIEGRDFRPHKGDQSNFIFNQTAQQQFDVPELMGTTIPEAWGEGEQKVIGICEDFNFRTLHHPITPIAFWCKAEMQQYSYFKLSGQNTREGIQHIEKVWEKLCPAIPFEYQFLDDTMQKAYTQELKFQVLISVLSLIAIVLSLVGVLAMISMVAGSKVKEIGIRKVNGATISQMMMLVTRRFLIWLAIAFVVVVPVVWYLMNRWLQQFAYQISLDWWVFALGGITVLLLTLLAVGWHAYRAATRNPVESLSSE